MLAWRQGKGRAANAAEEYAWLIDHPGNPFPEFGVQPDQKTSPTLRRLTAEAWATPVRGAAMNEIVRRQRRKSLTDKQVADLPRKRARYILADPEQRGMYLRVPVAGPVVFTAVARDPIGSKQIWATLGTANELTIDDAREKARDAIKRVKAGKAPFEPQAPRKDTVAAVVADWLKRHVAKNGLITGGEIERQLRVYVIPLIGDRLFAEIRRSDIARLLDAIEDQRGPWISDSVLTILRSVSTWYASRNDDYQIPFVRGQRRVPAHKRNRSRILNDAELKAVWRKADDLTAAEQKALADPKAEAVSGAHFGRFVQLSLLLAQRRESS